MDDGGAAIERLGARYDDRGTAVSVMRRLRERFGMGLPDIEVEELGSTRYEEPPSGTLLAGRFHPGIAEEAIELIRDAGGVIVERRLEPDPQTRRPPRRRRDHERRAWSARAFPWRPTATPRAATSRGADSASERRSAADERRSAADERGRAASR